MVAAAPAGHANQDMPAMEANAYHHAQTNAPRERNGVPAAMHRLAAIMTLIHAQNGAAEPIAQTDAATGFAHKTTIPAMTAMLGWMVTMQGMWPESLTAATPHSMIIAQAITWL
jgi:hypothetical protein